MSEEEYVSEEESVISLMEPGTLQSVQLLQAGQGSQADFDELLSFLYNTLSGRVYIRRLSDPDSVLIQYNNWHDGWLDFDARFREIIRDWSTEALNKLVELIAIYLNGLDFLKEPLYRIRHEHLVLYLLNGIASKGHSNRCHWAPPHLESVAQSSDVFIECLKKLQSLPYSKVLRVKRTQKNETYRLMRSVASRLSPYYVMDFLELMMRPDLPRKFNTIGQSNCFEKLLPKLSQFTTTEPKEIARFHTVIEQFLASLPSDDKSSVKAAFKALNTLSVDSPFYPMLQFTLAEYYYTHAVGLDGSAKQAAMREAMPYYQCAYQALQKHWGLYVGLDAAFPTIDRFFRERMAKAEKLGVWTHEEQIQFNQQMDMVSIFHEFLASYTLLCHNNQIGDWCGGVQTLLAGKTEDQVEGLLDVIYTTRVLSDLDKWYLLRAFFQEYNKQMSVKMVERFIDYTYDLLCAAKTRESFNRLLILLEGIPPESTLSATSHYILNTLYDYAERVIPLQTDQSIRRQSKQENVSEQKDLKASCDKFIAAAHIKSNRKNILKAFDLKPEQTRAECLKSLLIVRIMIDLCNKLSTGMQVLSVYLFGREEELTPSQKVDPTIHNNPCGFHYSPTLPTQPPAPIVDNVFLLS